jgi:hypothetical protein
MVYLLRTPVSLKSYCYLTWSLCRHAYPQKGDRTAWQDFLHNSHSDGQLLPYQLGHNSCLQKKMPHLFVTFTVKANGLTSRTGQCNRLNRKGGIMPQVEVFCGSEVPLGIPPIFRHWTRILLNCLSICTDYMLIALENGTLCISNLMLPGKLFKLRNNLLNLRLKRWYSVYFVRMLT